MSAAVVGETPGTVSAEKAGARQPAVRARVVRAAEVGRALARGRLVVMENRESHRLVSDLLVAVSLERPRRARVRR
jgi:hypothetical protein